MINWRMALTYCIHLDNFSKRGSAERKRIARTRGRKKQNLSYSTGHFTKSAEPLTVIPTMLSPSASVILNVTFNSTFSIVLHLPSSPSILKVNDIFSFHTSIRTPSMVFLLHYCRTLWTGIAGPSLLFVPYQDRMYSLHSCVKVSPPCCHVQL